MDSEVIGQQSVPNVAKLVREAKVMMARDRARKASQAKAKPTNAKEKAKVASDKLERYLKGIAITDGNGVTWRRIVSRWQKPWARVAKATSAGSLDETEASSPENTSVGGFGLCSFGNQCDDGKWNNCLDSGAKVSTVPWKNRDRAKQRRENPCKTKDPECYRL